MPPYARTLPETTSDNLRFKRKSTTLTDVKKRWKSRFNSEPQKEELFKVQKRTCEKEAELAERVQAVRARGVKQPLGASETGSDWSLIGKRSQIGKSQFSDKNIKSTEWGCVSRAQKWNRAWKYLGFTRDLEFYIFSLFLFNFYCFSFLWAFCLF